MKKLIKNSLFFTIILVSYNAFAYNHNKGKGGNNHGNAVVNKANCNPARAYLLTEFNDVKARLQPAGLLFYDKATGAAYEVPKNGKVHSIYAGSLWMGGTDVNGQLKLAAQLYGQGGSDFWTGPLSVTAGSGDYDPRYPVGDNTRRDFGEATITPETCDKYDQFYKMSKKDVIDYTVWWECGNVQPAPDNCDDIVAPSNEVLNNINNWPAHGDVSLAQDYYLAPFYDRNNDGIYNPSSDGDTPWYDDILGRDDIECGIDRRISLFGDETAWWVFNDKGNIHGETGGDPIGMEIRAQAFAFKTSDEVNKMTFFNYEMINRGTQTLKDTYFAQYVDTDLGNYSDDYVGCDVSRGLGYCYNGDAVDEGNTNSTGYGANPPAIGIDFFEGPYQDADGSDNPGPYFDTITKEFVIPTVAVALAQGGIVYKGLGIGYSDGIIDNERFGMKGFTYFSGEGSNNMNDPSTAAHYYSYMTGKWKDQSELKFGGTGYAGSPGGTPINSAYMFPADSDTLNWATAGTDPGFQWDETTNNNPKGDRRFVQAAGPFTLKPGAVNNITVGVIWSRSTDGDIFASVRTMKTADTKAQALFDNCFKIFDPPSAPRLSIQELENELILMLDNPNEKIIPIEGYEVEDEINIPGPESGVVYDRYYRFEGYQIYQVANDEVSAADIKDLAKARLVVQSDIKNNIEEIINFEFDDDLGFTVPVKKAFDGYNKGIQHSFKITEDLFATGQRTLVNNKTYYFIAVSYAYNNYLDYDPNDPAKLLGQKIRYVSSRNGYDLGSIRTIPATPHNPMPELGGTISNMKYGEGPEITRLDGRGNGNNAVDLVQSSIDYIVNNGFMENPTYKAGSGPLKVKVVDPLNVASGYFELKFRNYTNEQENEALNSRGIDTASWVVYRYDAKGGTILDSVTSERTISSVLDSVSKPWFVTSTSPQKATSNEQLVPEWGVSIQIFQEKYFTHAFTPNSSNEVKRYTNPIEASLSYGDSTKEWLSFIEDQNTFYPTNWIRSGTYAPDLAADCTPGLYDNPCDYPDEVNAKIEIDYELQYSKLLNGGIAPFRLVGYQGNFMPFANPSTTNTMTSIRNKTAIMSVPSIDIVMTSDQSKWTRCVVVELGRDATLNIGGAQPGTLRKSNSVGKDGKQDATGTQGMGWFPGYAIDVETGARLHMAFGENSFLGIDNGSDMLWNPTSKMEDQNGNPVFGGLHPIYVFGYNITGDADPSANCPMYDPKNENSNWVYDKYFAAANAIPSAASTIYIDLFLNLSWIANPILMEGKSLLSTDAKIRVRVNKEYDDFVATNDNNGRPMYGWSMDNVSTEIGSADALKDALELINVVPNPYYAFSEYEKNRLDTRVKITNLPDVCTIKIYNISGKLIRTFKKDSPITSQDWDMKNSKGIPIASGVYLIHVEVPDIGEVIVKFFGGVRQIDLENI